MAKRYKLIVNVPISHADDVRTAIGNAGGGRIGHYSHCSFSSRGTGRFKSEEEAKPFIGQAGQYVQVEEERIEVSPISAGALPTVIEAMIVAHPYEETGYEIIELINIEDVKP